VFFRIMFQASPGIAKTADAVWRLFVANGVGDRLRTQASQWSR
jgi:hypothetical protein